MDTNIRVEDELVQRSLDRMVRTGINTTVKTGLKLAAERVALPRVKITAPSVVDQYLAAGATSRRVYITTKGPKIQDRIAGLLEYGGRLGGPSDQKRWIYPKTKQAVRIGTTGELRANVPGQRVYKGRHRIAEGVQQALPHMADAVADELVDGF